MYTDWIVLLSGGLRLFGSSIPFRLASLILQTVFLLTARRSDSSSPLHPVLGGLGYSLMLSDIAEGPFVISTTAGLPRRGRQPPSSTALLSSSKPTNAAKLDRHVHSEGRRAHQTLNPLPLTFESCTPKISVLPARQNVHNTVSFRILISRRIS
jgi:hypothetical protein